ncbi:MAG: phosphatase [Proteobacteria bacterium]|nr:MAG: phosphatase [Pseudomonadota bacterium]
MISFEGAIFDMDGVLLDSEGLWRAVWQRAAKTHGYDLSDETHREMVGIARATNIEKVWNLAERGFDKEEFAKELRTQEQEIFESSQAAIREGVVEFLEGLRIRNIPCSVATSTRKGEALKRLKRAGLLDFFMAVVGGDEVALGKPNPEIYLRAANEMGVNPANCIVFEDSHICVTSVREAGLIGCYVPEGSHGEHNNTDRAQLTFASLKDVSTFLLK